MVNDLEKSFSEEADISPDNILDASDPDFDSESMNISQNSEDIKDDDSTDDLNTKFINNKRRKSNIQV
jgi:hypothetical protein